MADRRDATAPRRPPSRSDLDAARRRRLPDVLAPGLDVVFCGINPSLYSAAVGHHFARPGNRFWKALHRSGFTSRELAPSEDRGLLEGGLGLTNLAPRPTARADELAREELERGGRQLAGKLRRLAPTWVAVVGVTAYRQAFGRPEAGVGRREERIGPARVWVLPNPSGLNAHYQIDDLARAFGALRRAVGR